MTESESFFTRDCALSHSSVTTLAVYMTSFLEGEFRS
jgi:hypothetical protein